MNRYPIKHCQWDRNGDGGWDSSCVRAFVFIDGGPIDNGFLFCPYCGRALKEMPYEEDDA